MSDALPAAPRPGMISEGKLSELSGLTTRRLRQIADEGFFPPPVKGHYAADAAIKGMFRYAFELAKRKSSSAKEAETRLKTAKAEMAEEELKEFRQKYVLKEEIGPALRNVGLNQKSVLQQKLERELGPELPPAMQERVKGIVDEVLNTFREGVRAWMDGNDPEIKPRMDTDKHGSEE